MEELSKYQFGPDRSPKYDWDKLFNGSIWRLCRGEDFPASMTAKTFRRQVYSRAYERGLSARGVIENDNTLVIQVMPKKQLEKLIR